MGMARAGHSVAEPGRRAEPECRPAGRRAGQLMRARKP